MGVFKKSVSWTSTFVTTVLQENGRRSDVTFMVHIFWTPPYQEGDALTTPCPTTTTAAAFALTIQKKQGGTNTTTNSTLTPDDLAD